jgi:hypothetical protein
MLCNYRKDLLLVDEDTGVGKRVGGYLELDTGIEKWGKLDEYHSSTK